MIGHMMLWNYAMTADAKRSVAKPEFQRNRDYFSPTKLNGPAQERRGQSKPAPQAK